MNLLNMPEKISSNSKSLKFNVAQLNFFSEVSLMFLSVFVLMSKSWESTLQAMDSSVHARLALEVTKGGWRPQLPMPNFNDHPYLLFYLVGHFMRWVGAEAWSARFIPSFFGVLSVWATLRLGKAFFSSRVGLFASFLLLITPLFIQFGARFQLDPAMIFFMILSFHAWMDKKNVWAGLFCGMAVAIKSPVGFLLLPTIVIAEIFKGQKITFRTISTLMVTIFVSMIPPLLVWSSADFFSKQMLFFDYISRQVLGTALKGRGVAQPFDPLYFFHEVIGKSKIWAFFLWVSFGTLIFQIKKIKSFSHEWRLLAVASSLLVLIISVMKFKFVHYFLPAFPFMAITVVVVLDDYLILIEYYFRKILLILTAIVPVVLLVFPIKTAPEMFPALRKFSAIIQSYGRDTDHVLFVDFAQPYGSYGDYEAELRFYTHRAFAFSYCKDANEKTVKINPEWIITSGDHLSVCLNSKVLSQYFYQIKIGNQFLLGKIKPTVPFDLTPLYRELKAPIDGEAVQLPHDLPYRY